MLEDDRRVWVRYPADLSTRCEPAHEEGAQEFNATIRDISLGGMKLELPRPFQPGDLLTVGLPTADGEPIVTVLACVVHCSEVGQGQWLAGCNFSQELTQDELDAFGGRKEKCATPGDRTWARFRCDTPVRFQLVSSPGRLGGAPPNSSPGGLGGAPPNSSIEGEPRQGKVVNISASGLALLVDEPLEAGALLSVHLQQRARGVLTILACVVHTTDRGNGQQVAGCNFIRELSEGDLLSLL